MEAFTVAITHRFITAADITGTEATTGMADITTSGTAHISEDTQVCAVPAATSTATVDSTVALTAAEDSTVTHTIELIRNPAALWYKSSPENGRIMAGI